MKKRKQNLPRPAVHRMELWWAALPTVPGHVQRGTRPVVIVSNDLGNASSPVVSVVPCTTQRHKPALPTHVYLRGYGLVRAGDATGQVLSAPAHRHSIWLV